MNTDDEDIRHRGLVMARTDEFLAREREARETAAAVTKALESRGARQTEPTRTNLDAVERRITADHDARLSRAQSLTLIARIRSAEAAVERMTPVVVAAERWCDHGPAGAGIAAAVSGYRARIDGGDAPEASRLEAIAKAATAFVDEQGKRVSIERGHAIGLPEDFAATEFEALVRAVEGAGR